MQIKDDHTGPWFAAFAFRFYKVQCFFPVFQYDNLVVGGSGLQAASQDPDVRFVVLDQDDSVLAHSGYMVGPDRVQELYRLADFARQGELSRTRIPERIMQCVDSPIRKSAEGGAKKEEFEVP